ncbi:NAD-dependent epimerase/dehydratase family protein [Guptibacillus algicola]|uniref:NAD-dependent epimerase/dehydratase family protein n=1 Tax=Guptibacillus algicola TaxID=225844 RepID=UPI001CD7B56C|nr:NAD-dependent epimerase/dehydratase family protein [Alkalihalobacillus algicola]MCA0987855.1 NAD-dependent epimerase/dehydratase family protein [Alkalihalobacillus algicola]
MSDEVSILITGAAGFTGQEACRHFRKKGWNVKAVVRETSFVSEGIHIIQCDLTDRKAVERLMKMEKPTFLLHLAGVNSVQLSWKDPVTTMEANLLSTVYLLDSVRTSSPSTKIVLVGSALQYDPELKEKPHHPYALSKTMQIQVARHWADLFNLEIVLAKPTNLIGPGPSSGICALLAKHVVEMERNKKTAKFTITNFALKRDFLDVRDAVGAYETLFLFGERNRTYDIATGRLVTIRAIVDEMQSLTSVTNFVNDKKSVGMEVMKPIDVSELRKLGWLPNYSLHQSLNDTLEYYRCQNQ